MNYFNLLPPETIEFIFKKLNLNDLINLRIVDKRFKQICEQIKIKQLILSHHFDHRIFWLYTNDLIYKEHVIKFSKFQNYATIFQLDKYLKRIAISINEFNFSVLNKFKLLEQLSVITNKLIDNYKLNLDYLKIVDLYLEYNSNFKLTFDTIKLFAFSLINDHLMHNVVFNYPDKILFLEIDFNYERVFAYLEKFNNLQYLKIIVLYSNSIDRNILFKFKNLKILDLSVNYFCFDYDNSVRDIKFLINEKEKLKRSELEIYLNGVKLNDQIELKNCNQLEFQIKNYDLLKDNCYGYDINYCDLMKLIDTIPSSFVNKFLFIHRVKANDHIDNENQFIKFLHDLKYLSKLELINCELTKSFYDQLINFVYLNDLKFLKIKENKELEINFDFIIQLKELRYFRTNQIITNHIDLIYKLFKQNQNIEFFIFKFDSKNYIRIDIWNSHFQIKSHYLDDNLKKVQNFSIDYLKDLDDVISRLSEFKF